MNKPLISALSVLAIAASASIAFAADGPRPSENGQCCRGPGNPPPPPRGRGERPAPPSGPSRPHPAPGPVERVPHRVEHTGPIGGPVITGPSYPSYPSSGDVYYEGDCSTRQASEIYEEVDALVAAHPENQALAQFEDTLADVLRETKSSVKEQRLQALFGIEGKSATGQQIINAYDAKLVSLGLSKAEADASTQRLISALNQN